MESQDPPEPYKGALIEMCKGLVPSLEDFAFFAVGQQGALPSRIELSDSVSRLRAMEFRVLPEPTEVPTHCVIQWRF